MRHPIYANWSLDVPAEFTRREEDDGYVFFERTGGCRIVARVLCFSGNAENAVAKWRADWAGESGESEELDLPLVGTNFPDVAYSARRYSHDGSLVLAVAFHDGIVELTFDANDRSSPDLEEAVRIWKSLEWAIRPIWGAEPVDIGKTLN